MQSWKWRTHGNARLVRLWTHITAEALLHERKIVRVSSSRDAGQRAQSLDELIREGFRLLTPA